MPNGQVAFVCSRRLRSGDKPPGHESCPLCSAKLPTGTTAAHLKDAHGFVRG